MATLTQLDRLSEKFTDKTVSRLIKWGSVVLVLLLALFSVIYYKGQHVDSGPSLVDRQVSAAEDAVRAKPRDVSARLNLASVYQVNSQFDQAMAQYAEVLKAVPGNTTALMGEGQIKVQQGELDAAKALFTKVAGANAKAEFSNIDPTAQSAFYWLGSIALQQNNLDDAVKNLQVALRMDSGDADSWYLLGTAQMKKSDNKSAVVSLRKALAFVPTGWCDPYSSLATAYTATKQADEANYATGMNALCNKDVDGATATLKGLINGPDAVDALLGLGLIGEMQSDIAGATSWYQQVLKKDPNNSAAVTALNRLATDDGSGATAHSSTATNAKAK